MIVINRFQNNCSCDRCPPPCPAPPPFPPYPAPGVIGPTGPQGVQGAQGLQGPQGPAGKTPVKGTDYFTDADKEEMVAAVLAGLPDGNGVAY